MQTLGAVCSKAEPKIFAPPQTPFPGARDSQNLTSWRWSLPLPINPVWWESMHAISSYRGNRPTHTQTHTPTHKQTGPITIHCSAASAQCKNVLDVCGTSILLPDRLALRPLIINNASPSLYRLGTAFICSHKINLTKWNDTITTTTTVAAAVPCQIFRNYWHKFHTYRKADNLKQMTTLFLRQTGTEVRNVENIRENITAVQYFKYMYLKYVFKNIQMYFVFEIQR